MKLQLIPTALILFCLTAGPVLASNGTQDDMTAETAAGLRMEPMAMADNSSISSQTEVMPMSADRANDASDMNTGDDGNSGAGVAASSDDVNRSIDSEIPSSENNAASVPQGTEPQDAQRQNDSSNNLSDDNSADTATGDDY